MSNATAEIGAAAEAVEAFEALVHQTLDELREVREHMPAKGAAPEHKERLLQIRLRLKRRVRHLAGLYSALKQMENGTALDDLPNDRELLATGGAQ